MCDVVSGKAKPKVSGNDGLQSLKIFDAILRSTKTGEKLGKLMKRLKLGIIGGGPGSWIGHVHRIASRFDDKYEIVAGVFSRNYKINQSLKKYRDKKIDVTKIIKILFYKKIKDGIDVIAIMTPPEVIKK